MKNRLNPWADVILNQLLICQLAYDVALKACDPQNLLADEFLLPCKPRLNPLEFHGRRSSSAVPQRADAANMSSTVRSRIASID